MNLQISLSGPRQLYSNDDVSFTVFDYLSRNYGSYLLIKMISLFSCRKKTEPDVLTNSPDTRSKSSSRVVVISVSIQICDCVSRYIANGHLEKFAANSNPNKSQPDKIVVL